MGMLKLDDKQLSISEELGPILVETLPKVYTQLSQTFSTRKMGFE